MVETLGQKYPQYQFSYGKTEKGIFELKVFLDSENYKYMASVSEIEDIKIVTDWINNDFKF